MTRQEDGLRTRETILRVADQLFAARPTPPPLHEVARCAGVGRATVYRYFPHRHALAAAVATRALGRLERALRSQPAPPLRDVLRATLSTSLTMRSLFCLLREMPESEQRRHERLLVTLLAPAFRAAQSAGQLRPDVAPDVVLVVLEMLHSRPAAPHPDPAGQRLVDVVLDGLFHPGATGV
ncbi:TetR/AcrR family transcriptional regulator [Thalassiella azotivora]